MKHTHKIAAVVLAAAVVLGGASACASDAEVVSENIAKAADNFEIPRQIILYNGITGEYIAVYEGYCSFEVEATSGGGSKLAITCKHGKDTYTKNTLGLSDNVTFLSEQLDPAKIDANHYRVFLKPESVIPGVSLLTSLDD